MTIRLPSAASLSASRRRVVLVLAATVAGGACVLPRARAQATKAIERVKASIVAVGTFQKLRAPQFRFLGTGFAVGDGTLISTNAHVVPSGMGEGTDAEQLVIAVPRKDGRAQVRAARSVAISPDTDLALLSIGAPPIPALALRDSDLVAEGDELLFTGFPIGSVLGLFPATHRAMVATIAPIAIPASNARHLETRLVRRLQSGTFVVFQLDATSYPGNSGSPLYVPQSGEVVGVLNMAFVKGTKESALTNPSGISYAIPSNQLAALMASHR